MRSVTGVLLAALWVPVLSVLCGCNGGVVGNPSYETVKREVNLDGKQVVVIPFKDADHGYFESPDGNDLVEKVANQMRNHMPKTRFVSALPIRKRMEADEAEVLTPDEMGAVVRADTVLLGTLEEFSTQEPNTTGILRGTCRIELELYDVTRKQTIWSQSLTVNYPERGVGVPANDTTPKRIRDGLITLSADTIAKKFYTHKKRLGPPPMDW